MTRDFLSGLHHRLIDPFRGLYIVAHIAAISLTAFIVLTNLDWHYFELTRGTIQQLGLPAAIIGFFVPVVIPVGMYAYGHFGHQDYLRRAATAIAQSEMVAYLISTTYKAFTGRMQPEFYTVLNTIDNSRDFNFGFLQHGVFWGWPSSHAAVALAMVAAVFIVFPRNRIIQASAAAYGLFIALGVSVSIHWLSDAIAGAIVGAAAGTAVTRTVIQPARKPQM